MSGLADFECIVIGAGAAGVAAGRSLARGGASFILLEARQRAGGRAFTQNSGGFPVDLGAGWLHSADRNVLLPLAGQQGFAIDRETPPWQKSADARGFETGDQRAYRAEQGRFFQRAHQAAQAGRRRHNRRSDPRRNPVPGSATARRGD